MAALPAFQNEEKPAARSGDVEITLAGKTFTIRLTWEALLEIETGTGMGTMALARMISQQRHGLQEAAVIVTCGMKAAGEKQATVKKVAEMIFADGLTSIYDALDRFMWFALMGTSAEPPKAEADDQSAD